MNGVRDILEGLAHGDAEAILGAAETGRVLANDGVVDGGVIEPYATHLRETLPSALEVKALKDALTALIQRDRPDETTAAAIFALGKFGDREMVPFFRGELLRQLDMLPIQYAVVSQLLCTLSDLGEDTITQGFHSLQDVEKSIRDSRTYLERFVRNR